MNEQEPISFKNYCTCGGYACQMNGRDPAQPHMTWCPQREEYSEWYERWERPRRSPHADHEKAQ